MKQPTINMRRNIWLAYYIGMLVILLVFFSVASGFRFWRLVNIMSILHQMIFTIACGTAMLFVIAQGRIDLSIGSIIGLGGVVGVLASTVLGSWIVFPLCVLVGSIVGLTNGVLIAKCKMSALFATLPMMLMLRALVVFLVKGGNVLTPSHLLVLDQLPFKLPIFVVVVGILWYVFEYTKYGKYARALGANELACVNSGVPVAKTIVFSFLLDGLVAGIVAFFMICRVGGTSVSIGQGFEMDTMLAVFAGLVPPTGGSQSRMYRVILGSLTIGILSNGLLLLGLQPNYVLGVKGAVLVLIISISQASMQRKTRGVVAREA